MAERAAFCAFENENLHRGGSCGLWQQRACFLTKLISYCIEGRPRAAMTTWRLRDYIPTRNLHKFRLTERQLLVALRRFVIVYLHGGRHRQEESLHSKGGPHDDVRGEHARAQPLGNGRR